MSSSRQKNKPKNYQSPAVQLVFASGMLLLGCVLPILIIHTQNQIPLWKAGALELLSLGGLALLLFQLVLKVRLPLRLYAGLAAAAFLAISLVG